MYTVQALQHRAAAVTQAPLFSHCLYKSLLAFPLPLFYRSQMTIAFPSCYMITLQWRWGGAEVEAVLLLLEAQIKLAAVLFYSKTNSTQAVVKKVDLLTLFYLLVKVLILQVEVLHSKCTSVKVENYW